MCPEKYLFNQHIFDEPEEPEEPEAPPAPTFSEEELETVRQKTYDEAYKKGKEDGLEESKASRDQMIAQVLQKIAQDTIDIFNGEDKRENIFEQESLRLCLSVFNKCFPLYKKYIGLQDLENVLGSILENQHGQSKITIEVPEDAADGVREHLNTLSLEHSAQDRYNVIANNSLPQLSCKLKWEDGGAIRNLNEIADKIHTILQEHIDKSPSHVPQEHDNVSESDNLSDQDSTVLKNQASDLHKDTNESEIKNLETPDE